MSASGGTVLVVEDDAQLRRFLRTSLTSQSFDVVEAGSAREATALATKHPPALVLLDLGLPDLDGIELTRQLREWMRAPIIVLSARDREADKIAALDAGADDYLTKPFGSGELLARIRVALRHAAQLGAPAPSVLELGPLRVDLARHEVAIDGRAVHLTPIEYKLLVVLARNAGRVLTHRQLLREVWGAEAAGQTHYLRVYMGQLRRKLEPDPARPRLLATEPGVGYRLRDG